MATIKEFNKGNLQALRTELDALHKALEKKYGIALKVGNASYSNNEVTFKLKANTVSANGTVVTKEALNWPIYAELNGVGHFNVGDKFNSGGSIYEITGWNTRARKSPVMIKDIKTGKGYKCPTGMLLNKQPIK